MGALGLVAGFEYKDLGPDGGPWTEFDDPKMELHSTEGSSIAGAETSMKRYPSHFCMSPRERIRRQYISVLHSSYANKAHDTARIYQVEIVMFAASSPGMSDADLKWVGEGLWAIMDATGVPLNLVPVGFHGGDEGIKPYISTAKSPLRLTVKELEEFSGILAHQHMPAPDTHWDVGRWAVLKSLRLARPGSAPATTPTPDPEDDEMNRYGAWLFEFVRMCYDQYASRPADTGGLHAWVGEFRKDTYYPAHLGGQFNSDQARDNFVAILKSQNPSQYRPR